MNYFLNRKEKSNKELIEQIILENYNQYYRLAYSYVHNDADACDIVQNGAYKALRSSHTLKNPEYAKTWIYRIMLNECFRYFKEPQLLSWEETREEEKNGSFEDSYSNIDLQKAINALSSQDKAVIILKYFEDKKLEEIADILEENVNTVKSRLYRGMKKLRLTLSDEADE